MLSGGLYGAAIGGTLGAVGGVFSGMAKAEAADKLRKEVRRGVAIGEATTLRETAGILGSQAWQGAADWIRSLYGIQGDYKLDMAKQLESLYGPDAFTGWGARATAHNQAFLQRTLGPEARFQVERENIEQALESIRNRPEVENVIDMSTVKNALNIGSQRGLDETFMYYGGQGREQVIKALEDRLKVTTGNIERLRDEDMRRTEELRARTGEADRRTAAYGAQAMATGESALDPLTRQFTKSLMQAQTARGLYSSHAAASAEASGLAALRAQMQAQMLPQLLGLAQAPSTIAKNLEPANLARNVFMSTGGGAAYGVPNPAAISASAGTEMLAGGFSGFAQGAMLGAGLGMQFQGLGGGVGGGGGGGFTGVPAGGNAISIGTGWNYLNNTSPYFPGTVFGAPQQMPMSGTWPGKPSLFPFLNQ